jgi:ADP-ribose pyrophosphatase YjhB (NUDIX family)
MALRYFDKPPKIVTDRACAKGVLLSRNDKVLLLQKPSGAWDLPGGKLRTGESWLDGLSREVREESGLELDRPGWITGWLDASDKTAPMLKGIFVSRLDCTAKKARIAISKEHIDGAFFSAKKIDGLSLAVEYAKAITWALEKVGA